MSYRHLDLDHLCALAIQAAQKAGAYIATHSFQDIDVEYKSVGTSVASSVFTEVDMQSQKIIIDMLSASCDLYDIGMLAEESAEDTDRLAKELFWAIDPLDGSLPFIQQTAGFAVSIALVTKGGEAILGVVYDPVLSTTYHAIKGNGVFRNNRPLVTPSMDSSTSFLTWHMDRSLLKQKEMDVWKTELTKIAMDLGYQGLRIESSTGAVMHAIAVVESSHAIYLKPPKTKQGGGSIWDFAATSIIAMEAGVEVCNFQKRPLNLNDSETHFMNKQGIIYCNVSKILDCL
ncbi:hypothetical protein OAT16_00940 [Prolixibacteraceae bacterium]|nr:hypothetical protein [Prolixibacteraceae bacterium]